MHIIIAAISAIAGLVWALNSLQRSGVNLNSFNPFYWLRRRRWSEQIVNPLYAIESPRELTAVLAFGVLKLAGDPTVEQKRKLLKLFVDELRYSEKEAGEMYIVASHLIGTDPNYEVHADTIMKTALPSYSDEQKQLTLNLIRTISASFDAATAAQSKFVDAIEAVFTQPA